MSTLHDPDQSTQSTMPEHAGCFVQAYAKINLTLDVLGRRTDGYHDLATIMQTMNLSDTLCLTPRSDEQVQVVCSVPGLDNASNLVARAAELVRQRLRLKRGLTIELYKRTPIAAGLGGGSSDAAAVLLALRAWWQLPLTIPNLLELAAELGSDVPFFIHGGLALCEGRGERVTPLKANWPISLRWLLLLKPAIGLSTATIFRNLNASDYSDGAHSQAVRQALEGQQVPASADLYNSLERGVLATYPEVALAREALLQAGAHLVRLSGSGPTLYAPFASLDQAQRSWQSLHSQGYEVYLTHVRPSGQAISFF